MLREIAPPKQLVGGGGSPVVVAPLISSVTVEKRGNGKLPGMTSAPEQRSLGGGGAAKAPTVAKKTTQIASATRDRYCIFGTVMSSKLRIHFGPAFTSKKCPKKRSLLQAHFPDRKG